MKGVLNWEKRARRMSALVAHPDHGGVCSHRLTRMCFANGKTVSIVEAAVSKVHMTRSTRETVIMPRVAQGFNILVACFNTQITPATKCRKDFVVVINTIGFFVLPMKDTILKRLATGGTYKTLHMPCLI